MVKDWWCSYLRETIEALRFHSVMSHKQHAKVHDMVGSKGYRAVALIHRRLQTLNKS